MRARRIGLAVAVLAVAAGCGTDEGGDDVDDAGTAGAAQQLSAQRDDVRSLTRDVAPVLATALPGTPAFANGSWEGCDTADLEFRYRNFKYVVSGRIDAGAGSRRPYAAPLAAALEQQRFDVQTDPEGLTARRDGLEVRVREYPDQGFVLFGVSGPCVDVPEDEREAWDRRQEPQPDVLGSPS